ncbi:helix-turn-helix domain-containing protein [Prosthecomicrobium hirschii]|uniref:helix-turn-helix domain-containing protein n=1 Tax=Prosthecodimorpha hirschii TaxID=665126 RepID=UPI002220952C|nr:hypothetical protein [Prosthecomicrobium hirschii]MCW1840565.1 hypothetical protein [Prosthecomicrobium hirschii]
MSATEHYHYEECGLDHVYLVNGFTKSQTPYGEGIAIKDVEKLHEAIARTIIAGPQPIRGQELRFLRKFMDMSQKTLASLMGETEQDIFRWEKKREKSINGAADRLIRVIVGQYLDGTEIRPFLERLAELDQVEPTDILLEDREGHWKQAA